MGVFSTAAGVVVGLFGGLLLFGAAVGAKRSLDLGRVSVVPASDVSDGQLVGLSGTVADPGGLESPLTGSPAVAHKWTVAELTSGTNTGRRWNKLTVEGAIDSFDLETDDGTPVTVQPPETVAPRTQLEFDCEQVYRVEPNDDPPERVQRLIDDGVVEPSDGSLEDDLGVEFDDRGPIGTRRYSEYALDEGDDVWVYGKAERRGTGLLLQEGELFVLSDADVDDLQQQNIGMTVVLALAGLLSMLFAYGLLT